MLRQTASMKETDSPSLVFHFWFCCLRIWHHTKIQRLGTEPLEWSDLPLAWSVIYCGYCWENEGLWLTVHVLEVLSEWQWFGVGTVTSSVIGGIIKQSWTKWGTTWTLFGFASKYLIQIALFPKTSMEVPETSSGPNNWSLFLRISLRSNNVMFCRSVQERAQGTFSAWRSHGRPH